MKKTFKKLITVVLLVVILISNTVNVFANSSYDLDLAIKDTAKFMHETVKNPQVGSIGGEWAVLGLARSNYAVPEDYYQKYYKTVEDYVKSLDGKLHDKKHTEYSRLIVALTAIGKDATNVGGYDLTKALGDFEGTIFQGLNGPIWALLALDSGNYDMPKNSEAKTQATRNMYIEMILDRQLDDGGWTLFPGDKTRPSDPDITGMALQALAKYQDIPEVKKAIEEALNAMSKQQLDNAGFRSWGSENSESAVQVMVALGELGIPLTDKRFVKNGRTLLDNVMDFYVPGKGFLHTKDGQGSNQMASEQAFYGLVSAQRAKDGQSSLYRMDDAITISEAEYTTDKGLENKDSNINFKPIIKHGITFEDITGVNAHKNQTAIEALAARDILNGKTEKLFNPEETMTRAEFATIIVRSLGLDFRGESKFSDVKPGSWYEDYIAIANSYNIVNGTGNGKFNPNGNITREEAAVMLMRAAKLTGLGKEFNENMKRDILAQFEDYVTTKDWSREGLAFLYFEDILDQKSIKIKPKELVTRAEVAQIIFNMLGKANLL